MNVDSELKPDLVYRLIEFNDVDSTLVITYKSDSIKLIRNSINSLFENIKLILQTLNTFDSNFNSVDYLPNANFEGSNERDRHLLASNPISP